MTTLPEHPDFERLDFTHSKIGRPQIAKQSIRVRVRHLWVFKGFPGYDQEKLFKEATVVIEGVMSSERELDLYIPGTGKLSGMRETIVDGPFAEVKEPVFSMYCGGPSYDPEAWVEWYIVAASVRVEDGEEYSAEEIAGT
jgi:hypothetical protein